MKSTFLQQFTSPCIMFLKMVTVVTAIGGEIKTLQRILKVDILLIRTIFSESCEPDFYQPQATCFIGVFSKHKKVDGLNYA